jgi:hypothetical protein
MTTVRVKLIVTPAVLGAILQSNASREQEIQQVERRVDSANRRFESELDDYQRNSRLALTFADLTPRFQKALAEGDPERAQRFVDRLSEVYKYRVIAAADAHGVLLARGNTEGERGARHAPLCSASPP